MIFLFRAFILSLCFSTFCFAKVPDYFFQKETDLKTGYSLFIMGYDHRLGGVFEVQTSQDKRQKNHYTRLGDLSIAVSKIKRNSYKRRPKKLVGRSFKIDKARLKTYKAPRHIN